MAKLGDKDKLELVQKILDNANATPGFAQAFLANFGMLVYRREQGITNAKLDIA